jgi:hypothetical protein
MSEAKKPDPIPPEHHFVGRTLEDWEMSVFRSAEYFTVFRKVPRKVRYRHMLAGDDNSHRQEFKTFPGAAVAAFHDEQALVYAIAKTGRSTLLPRHRWAEYAKVWEQDHPGDANV